MSVAQALYRSMWRWVRSPAVRCNPHFALPLDKLPASVVRAAERLESPRGAAGSRELLRLAWREAASTSGEAATAAELDDAFRVLRVLGELGEELEALQKKRASNAWRVDVEMRIGEVVRHSQYGYRGVVLGWDRKAEVDVSGWDGLRKSSRGGDQPFYRLLPDYTDCAELLGGPREVKYVAQENLERLPPRYTRVHHPALLSPGAFLRYDATAAAFVPSDELAYEYPGSRSPGSRSPGPEPPESEGPLGADGAEAGEAGAAVAEAARTVEAAVTRASQQLRDFVAAVDQQQMQQQAQARERPGYQAEAGYGAEEAAPGAAESEGSEAEAAQAGVAGGEEWRGGEYGFPGGEELPAGAEGNGRRLLSHVLRLADTAAAHEPASRASPLPRPASLQAGGGGAGGAGEAGGAALRGCFDALHRLGELAAFVESNAAERAAKADRGGITFGVGQVLRHRKFGFRAAVLGWERRPEVDVSGWDGVQGLPSGADQPFYRMVPDMGDCVGLLGGPRGVRYVAQENLEELPLSERAISHELLPHFFDGYDAASGTFLPVQQLRYWYSRDPLPDTGLAVLAAEQAAAALDKLSALLHSHALDARGAGLLEPLMMLLGAAGSAADSAAAERAALALLAAHPSGEVRELMRASERSVEGDDLLAARGALDEALDIDAGHAELFARRAAVHLRAGRPEAGLSDARDALQRDARHFAARTLEGSALRELRRYDEAVDAFEAALRLHPWAPGVVPNIFKAERARRILGNA